MEYHMYVKKHRELFKKAGFLKMAKDAAWALDALFSSIDLNDWRAPSEASEKEELFRIFSAICLKSRVPLPPYENLFIEAWLPKFDKYVKDSEREARTRKALDYKRDVHMALKGRRNRSARLCRALASALEQFPNAGDGFSDSIKPRQMRALINRHLVDMGMEPLRPDTSHIRLPNTENMHAPAKLVKLVVVDDQREEIFRTIYGLLGWPNTVFDFYQYLRPDNRSQKDYVAVAKNILDLEPDIVLMDQGLANLDGHELVMTIKNLDDGNIVFVANTGGDDKQLRDVGCMENCDKGKSIAGLCQAMRMFR